MRGRIRGPGWIFAEPIREKSLRIGQRDLLILRVKGIKISHGVHLLSKRSVSRTETDCNSEVRTMSEEQKKQVEGVLHEMKHMNPQQIEIVIAYMQGVTAAAKLTKEKKEA